MCILPLLIKMREAIEDYWKARGYDAPEVERILELNEEKEKLTALGFRKKYGKFLAQECRVLPAEIVLHHAVKTIRLGIYIIVVGLIIAGLGFFLLFLFAP